ncbi:putative tricarboxylic transport membrane protein [Micromonospora pallida]|uniref:Putative tricarboxylic transport membrane protein n=1 Tax=Micromonospora pallida TaxID=145854 RepID=A0A1C6S7Q3_9ACTN|nr:tripartite tricarboxylate transporter permease [Micromonospora pallida]SCL25411.1 putative tricarboxylic transport membrane protein [Micromonospora pallida]
MDALGHLAAGFATVLTPANLALAFLGCVLGMLVGVLPGFGPAAAMSLLLPITFTMGPTSAIIVLAAILYGSAYGGTITAVLLNVPGETSSVATTLDGYRMARQGRAGQALSIAAIGSFVGGLVGLLGFILATPLSRLALAFGPAEFFGLTLLGLVLVIGLATGSVAKALVSAAIGLAVGVVGIDPGAGIPRFTMGQPDFYDGINIIPLVMGLFGISELLTSIERSAKTPQPLRVNRILPSRTDLRRSVLPIARGSVIGFFIGLLPGSPGATCSFTSYVVEKRFSKHRGEFGKGAIEGVAGPETANNSMAISAMIPMFTLGIPTSATMAVMMGAFTINGLVPGPLLFQQNADVAWAIIASMFVGNVILLVLNIPLVRIWIAFLRIPYRVLYVVVFAFLLLGAYSLDNSVFNIYVMLFFGLLGYALRKVDVPLAPAALTIVLGPIMESSLRTALSLSRGDLSVLVGSPMSATLISLAALLLVGAAVRPLVQHLLSRQPAGPAAALDQSPPRVDSSAP